MIKNIYYTLKEIMSTTLGEEHAENIFQNISENNLKAILNSPEEEILKIIKDKKAAKIISKLQEFTVLYFEPSIGQEIKLSSNENVAKYLKANLGYQSRELFMAFFLDTANILLHKEIIFCGTIDECYVYPREIIKIALEKNASAMILIHNHTSQNYLPSEQDTLLTKHIEQISEHLGLKVYDHLITTQNHLYSTKAQKIIQ